MTFTKNQRRAALTYALSLFDHDDTSPLFLCLKNEGVQYIDDFVALPPDFINTMTYTPPSPNSSSKSMLEYSRAMLHTGMTFRIP